MSITKIMHDMAMEFYDQAKLSKIKGNEEEYNRLLQQAYLVEREAALKMPVEEADSYWQYLLIRSAAHLAYQCGEYEQALQLIYLGWQGIHLCTRKHIWRTYCKNCIRMLLIQ